MSIRHEPSELSDSFFPSQESLFFQWFVKGGPGKWGGWCPSQGEKGWDGPNMQKICFSIQGA